MKLSVFVFLDKKHPDGDVYLAYCPELDLVGSGHGEEEAKSSFEWVMKDYIDDMLSQGSLEEDLLYHGWTRAKDGRIKEPALNVLARSRKLGDILKLDSFKKISVPFVVA